MSATRPSRGRPSRCPRCGRTYAFRVPLRYDDEMNLVRHYRCERGPAYVYVHEIAFDGPTRTTGRPLPVDAAALHELLAG